MTALPARPAIPARPAAYVLNRYVTDIDDADMTEYRNSLTSEARDGLGWPAPEVYADAGQPGSQLAALTEAIKAGRHDGVFATEASQLGDDLAQIEAFDRLCRQHGVLLRFRWHREATDTGALFGVLGNVKDFTVTDEHLRLLRRAYVSWEDAEFGAPSIDPKRPYGNSNVYGDIAEILGLVDGAWQDEMEKDWPPPELEWRFLRLYVETAIALQIALATGEFRAGPYVRGSEHNTWKRDEAQNP